MFALNANKHLHLDYDASHLELSYSVCTPHLSPVDPYYSSLSCLPFNLLAELTLLPTTPQWIKPTHEP